MSISWGSYEGTNNEKVGIEVTQSPSTVTSDTSSVTLTVKYYVYSQYSVNDSQQLNLTGAITGSSTNGLDPLKTVGSDVLVTTRTLTVSTVYGSSVSKTFTATISGHYGGATPDHTYTYSVPARPYQAPAPVSGMSITRNSDGTINLSWTNNPTSSAPYGNVVVDKRYYSINGSAWSVWATEYWGTSTTSSYTDSTATLSNAYEYRVYVKNGTLSSTHTYGSTVYATPKTASNLLAVRASTSSNTLTWDNNTTTPGPYSRIYLRYKVGDGSYTDIPGSYVSGTQETYTHTGVSPSSSYTYAIRPWNSTGFYGNYIYSSASTVDVIPNPPASLSVAQTTASGGEVLTKNTITITRPSTADPYGWDGWKLDRWDSSSNTWTQIATMTGSTNTYDDTSISLIKDRKYSYRARSYNVAGDSPYTAYYDTWTPPYAMSNFVATRSGKDISLSWTNPSGIETAIEIYHGTSADSYTSYTKIATLSANSTSYTHTDVDQLVFHKYKIRNTVNNSLYSTYATSNEVQMLSKPNSPTLTGSFVNRIGYVDVETTEVKVAWVHNPVDGSPQEAYKIRYADNVELVDYEEITGSGTTSIYTLPIIGLDPIPIVNGKTYYWQVSTKGAHADYSDFSSTATFNTSSTPTVSITSGATASESYQLTWDYSQEEGVAQKSAIVTVKNSEGTVIKTQSVTGSNTTCDIDMWFEDLQSYTILISVTSNHDLASVEDSIEVTSSHQMFADIPDQVATVSVTKVSDDAVVSWTAPAGGYVVAPTSIRVERWDNISMLWSLVSTVNPSLLSYTDTSLEDNHKYMYRIVSINEQTGMSTSRSLPLDASESIYTTLGAPAGLRVTQEYASVVLTWNNTVSYSGFQTVVEKSLDEVSWDELASVDEGRTSYNDTSIDSSTLYYYRVKSELLEPAMSSSYSDTVSITTKSISAMNADSYVINIPPVRRRGPRESVKENIEAGEFGAIANVLDEMIDSIELQLQGFVSVLGERLIESYDKIEAAKAQREED